MTLPPKDPAPAAPAPPPVPWWRTLARSLGIVVAIALLHSMLAVNSMAWSVPISVVLALGAIARLWLPDDRRYAVMTVTGLVVLFLWKPRSFYFEVPFVALLWFLRKRPAPFLGAVVALALLLPKTLRWQFYHHPERWEWISSPALAHIILISLLYVFERRRGRLEDPSYTQWMTLYASASNPLNPLNFGPLDMWRVAVWNARAVASSLALLALKGVSAWYIDRHLGRYVMGAQTYASLQQAGFLGLWFSVMLTYVRLALYLSGTADVAVAILRIFGWQLDHPFRFALLAWNPVELWRRWSIYNRKLLIKCFYFPLGGGQKRRYLNVMITFWASALVMHTGWFGSVYWAVGPAGWRDQTLYFTLQGFAVVACLLLWQRLGKDPGSDRQLRLSPGRILGVIGTQAYSGWAHIVVMAPHIDLMDRFRLMLAALGFGD